MDPAPWGARDRGTEGSANQEGRVEVAERIGFTDGNGVRWNVAEWGRDDVMAGLDEPPVTWLEFETELEIRRLWTFPEDWPRLAPWQLELLCRRASTVVARFPRRAAAKAARDEQRQQPRIA
jgi:hypothetical protein